MTRGIAAVVAVPWQTGVPVGTPKTGYPAEVQAHTAVANPAAQIRGEPTRRKDVRGHPRCVMDTGNNGVVILADKMLRSRVRRAHPRAADARETGVFDQRAAGGEPARTV